jgi:hypothetical protein
MKTTHRIFLALAAVLVTGLFTTSRADASERVSVGLNFGSPVYYAPAPVVERRWIPGHYETRVENVVIEPRHVDRQWVPEVRSTFRDAYGAPYTVVTSAGFYREYVVPARLERREVQVWVPGCYEGAAVVYSAPVRPHVGIGAFFHF